MDTALIDLEREKATKQPRDANGRFIKGGTKFVVSPPAPSTPSSGIPFVTINKGTTQTQKPPQPKSKTPPLLEVKVTNPIVYIRSWWKRVLSNEGVDFRFRIHPLTAIAIASVVAVLGFRLGRISLPAGSPLIKYVPQLAPVDPWKETAFTGTLNFIPENKKYYLITSEAQAVRLEFPANVNTEKLVGKRILAMGKYNTDTGVMVVTDASNLEILPASVTPIPINPPAPNPAP